MRRFTLILVLVIILSAAPPVNAAENTSLHREISVRITYATENVYGGRLENALASFTKLQAFFDGTVYGEARSYSFLKDVLQGNMTEADGFVNTYYGFGYGACGAPSLLNHLVHEATYRDSDGTIKPVLEMRRWKRERNPTYGKYGAAIFLDPQGTRSSDYMWRINPDYDGQLPRIRIDFERTGESSATVTMTMMYTDEIANPLPANSDGAEAPVLPAGSRAIQSR
ncbi:MAG: hypothetical protein OHK0023_05750 [Anaerolineae bacterium]